MAKVTLAEYLGGETRFGMWNLISEEMNAPRRHRRALCRCDCGTEKVISAATLKNGSSTNCGCVRHASFGSMFRTHGKRQSGEYRIWCAMKTRCGNPNSDNYVNYGARGISVCSRWSENFDAFLADMGQKPSPGHSIDRINNDGNYEPSNCRWATAKEQAANTRRSVR